MPRSEYEGWVGWLAPTTSPGTKMSILLMAVAVMLPSSLALVASGFAVSSCALALAGALVCAGSGLHSSSAAPPQSRWRMQADSGRWRIIMRSSPLGLMSLRGVIATRWVFSWSCRADLHRERRLLHRQQP